MNSNKVKELIIEKAKDLLTDPDSLQRLENGGFWTCIKISEYIHSTKEFSKSNRKEVNSIIGFTLDRLSLNFLSKLKKHYSFEGNIVGSDFINSFVDRCILKSTEYEEKRKEENLTEWEYRRILRKEIRLKWLQFIITSLEAELAQEKIWIKEPDEESINSIQRNKEEETLIQFKKDIKKAIANQTQNIILQKSKQFNKEDYYTCVVLSNSVKNELLIKYPEIYVSTYFNETYDELLKNIAHSFKKKLSKNLKGLNYSDFETILKCNNFISHYIRALQDINHEVDKEHFFIHLRIKWLSYVTNQVSMYPI